MYKRQLFSFSWDDAFIAAMQDDSPIKNKVGTAPLPGADKVWNRVSGKWENQFNQAPYIVWGWAVGVAKKVKYKRWRLTIYVSFLMEQTTKLT